MTAVKESDAKRSCTGVVEMSIKGQLSRNVICQVSCVKVLPVLYNRKDTVCQNDEQKDSELLLIKYNRFNCVSHNFQQQKALDVCYLGN